MPLSNFDPLSPISASNPAPQTPAVNAEAVSAVTPSEPVPEAVAEESPAPLTSENSDILSLLQGKSPEQIAQLLALAQGTSESAAPAEETPELEAQPTALETQPAADSIETPTGPEAQETQAAFVELPAIPQTAPAVSETPVEAPIILEEPIAENPAPMQKPDIPQEEQQQSTGLGLQIAQPAEETPVAEAPAEQETEAALPEVSTELFPEGNEEGEEVLNFEGMI